MEHAWKTSVVNETPTRSLTDITIGSFTYSSPDCKLNKYTIEGTDKDEITLVGTSKISYKTDYIEPRTLSFTLRVHAQGDGIHGAVRQITYPTTIKVQGCDNEANVITNPDTTAWKTNVLNDEPTRSNTIITIGGFTYSNPYCGLLRYELSGQNFVDGLISVSGNKFTYKTDKIEPFNYDFQLWVIA